MDTSLWGRWWLGATALALVAFASSALASPVLKTRKNEDVPAAAPGYLAWSQYPRGGGLRTLFVKPDGGSRFRVNPPGTGAQPGAFDGSTLLFSLHPGRRANGDIKVLDLVTGATSDPPAGVNTEQNEMVASRSGDWLLFLRGPRVNRGTQNVILRNLTTGEERLLATGNYRRGYAAPGAGPGLVGNVASWVKCKNYSRCDVFRYDIPTASAAMVPNPGGKALYAASLAPDGTLYFVQSSFLACGRGAGIWRFTTAGVKERVTKLPRGFDVSRTSPVVNPDGSTTIFYDRYDCRDDDVPADIYKVTV